MLLQFNRLRKLEHRGAPRERKLKLRFRRKEQKKNAHKDEKKKSPLNFKSRTRVNSVELCAQSTLAALPPFSSTVPRCTGNVQ